MLSDYPQNTDSIIRSELDPWTGERYSADEIRAVAEKTGVSLEEIYKFLTVSPHGYNHYQAVKKELFPPKVTTVVPKETEAVKKVTPGRPAVGAANLCAEAAKAVVIAIKAGGASIAVLTEAAGSFDQAIANVYDLSSRGAIAADENGEYYWIEYLC